MQGDHLLDRFIIWNVKTTGRALGGGAYGSVEELELDGLTCAGKKLHESLIRSCHMGSQSMVEKYYKECSLLSDLRHPNIVQFLGICFLPDSHLPVLVMERLQGSLDELLENTPNIPLFTKVSILQDVARGLVYLHNQSPSVIHRDLSARNILINSDMKAKIADLGNARLADVHPNQVAQTMTPGVPGTPVYMPPEALDEVPRYGPSLDMFSFGHLSLFTAIQIFPHNLLAASYQDAETKEVKARSEIERRVKYINILHEQLGKENPLVVLIKSCLEFEPSKRITAREALAVLQNMWAAISYRYKALSRLQLEKSLFEHETKVQQQSQIITSSSEKVESLEAQLQECKAVVADLKAACKAKDEKLLQLPLVVDKLKQVEDLKSGLEQVCVGKDKALLVKNREVTTVQSILSEERKVLKSLKEECAEMRSSLDRQDEEIETLKRNIESLQEEKNQLAVQVGAKEKVIANQQEQAATADTLILEKESALKDRQRCVESLQEENDSLSVQLDKVLRRKQSLEAATEVTSDLLIAKDACLTALQNKKNQWMPQTKMPRILTCSLHLLWQKPIRLPTEVKSSQAVVIEGKVYIGGGVVKSGDFNLLEYSKARHQWKVIQSPLCYFSMAVFSNQLIIAGGRDEEGHVCGRVWTLDCPSHKWSQPFPDMPTAREWSSALSYMRWVVVVGGKGSSHVDVLDTVLKQWYTALPIPSDALRPSLAVIQGILCVNGAISVSLPALISDALCMSQATNKQNSAEWSISSVPATPSFVVAFHDTLLAVGGGDFEMLPSSDIMMYLPHAEQWIKVAELPTPRRLCTCTILPDTEKLMVIGGVGKGSSRIDIGALCHAASSPA